jgi:hypothetical protein
MYQDFMFIKLSYVNLLNRPIFEWEMGTMRVKCRSVGLTVTLSMKWPMMGG